ncbi:ankyrin repeats (3 copies) domain-containing protein [Ditylenchus destructor]|uniref:Ankyrin repeats (3 copies) domain-containing protein n=1 Tax=Ditylenchus destructor TaxID=166010 RepID=A0AAD4MVZ3_9BILA|nr:ankyrin repeats (3 copies) domain-containing protein [Ditylenchus destructor]
MRPPLATENYQDTDPIFPISQKYDSQNTNVRNQANGTNPVAAEESRTSRCQCCPYGFHIDLDFVKFAEDVATGKEHIQNWSSPSKRPRRLFTSPFEGAASPHATSSGYGLDSSIDERGAAVNNSMFDSSILSKSMDEGHSDLDDILNADMNLNITKPSPQMPTSILKHRSDSNVPQAIRKGGYQNGGPPSEPKSIQHQSRLKQHQQRAYIASPPASRRYNGASSTISDSLYSTSMPQYFPTMPLPLRTSTPSKNVNDEIQQILSSTKSYGNYGQTRAMDSGGRTAGFTSAPTSPVPKTYYTAIAQSISQLKNLPPLPPPKPTAIQTIFNNTANRPGWQSQNSHPIMNSGSGNAGQFNYNYTISSSSTPVTSGNGALNGVNQNGFRQNLPPRRYLDSGYRNRVLSPEPEALSTQRFTPNVLRNSNLQSRSYYHTLGSLSSPSRAYQTSSASQVPYRYRQTGKSSSSLFDLDSFASVRRRKPEDATNLFYDTPVSSGGGGATLTDKWRSVSPTQQRSASAPKWRLDHANDVLIGDIPSDNLDYQFEHQRSASTNPSFINPPHSASAFTTLIPKHNYVREEESYSTTLTQPPPAKLKEAVLYNSGTQTTLPNWKSISVSTDSSLLESLIQSSKPVIQVRTVSTETKDLDPPKSKPPPPTPPPKPKRKDSAQRKPKLEIEFQYCLGHEPEYNPGEEPAHLLANLAGASNRGPTLVETGTDSLDFRAETKEISTSTSSLNFEVKSKSEEKSTTTNPPALVTHKETITEPKISVTSETQTENSKTEDSEAERILQRAKQPVDAECQTDSLAEDWLKEEVTQRLAEEKANKRKSVDKVTETDEEESNSDQFIMITCAKCDRTSSISSGAEPYEKITDDIEAPMLVDAEETGSLDRVSIETDVQTVIMVEPGQQRSTPSRQVDPSRAEAIRKLLTDPQQKNQSFQRNSGNYRSYRTEKCKAEVDDLDYITNRHFNKNDSAEPSTPSSGPKRALKEMVVLKKGFSGPMANLPEPVSAKIPRPKFAKYSPTVVPETPDEEDEAADRLTPLRSEMRSLVAWGSMPRGYHPNLAPTSSNAYYSHNSASEPSILMEEHDLDHYQDDDGFDRDGASSSSSEGGGTYEMSEREDASVLFGADFELSAPLKEALETVDQHLTLLSENAESGLDPTEDPTTDWAYKYVQHEWLKLSTRRNANAELVEAFIDALEGISPKLMEFVVNLNDQNGNTALHYAVSHENYDVISVLLDSKVMRVDEMNKAGYSAVMLAALCTIKNETELAIIQRLFNVGNVNAKALKHAQTALMLAASHGRVDTTNLLLNCGADVNIQDADGSTALMCAAEHGQKEIVKILLKRPNIDASLTDCDNQTALSIAVDNHHRDIGVLIYAHLNFSRLEQNENSVAV